MHNSIDCSFILYWQQVTRGAKGMEPESSRTSIKNLVDPNPIEKYQDTRSRPSSFQLHPAPTSSGNRVLQERESTWCHDVHHV